MKYGLIVFDWDGTIIDSAATIAECIRDSARDMKLPVPTPEQASHVIGLGLHDSLRLAVPELQSHQYPEFVAHYRRHFLAREDSMALFEGMKELLGELNRMHLLAIATGKSRRGLDRALAATGVGPLFTASRCADETNPKPHPAMLIELMDELRLSKNQILMVGDTSHDLEMARAAEVDSVAVTYGAHPEQGLRACGPKGCVASVKELKAWLALNA
jgi:phosphoglycolate phosphatase